MFTREAHDVSKEKMTYLLLYCFHLFIYLFLADCGVTAHFIARVKWNYEFLYFPIFVLGFFFLPFAEAAKLIFKDYLWNKRGGKSGEHIVKCSSGIKVINESVGWERRAFLTSRL